MSFKLLIRTHLSVSFRNWILASNIGLNISKGLIVEKMVHIGPVHLSYGTGDPMPGCLAGVDGQAEAPGQDSHTLGMIRMLVGHKYGVQVRRVFANGVHGVLDPDTADAGIYKDLGFFSCDEQGVAAATAVETAETQ